MTNDFYTEEELKCLGSCGTNVQIDRSVKLLSPQNIHIGNDVRIDAFSFLSGRFGIIIGNNVHIAVYNQLMASGDTITIHDFVGISARCSIFTASDDYVDGWLTGPTVPFEYRKVKAGPITFHKHAIIGAGTVIMPDCIFGEGSSVGALSFVNKSVPNYTVVSGNPAKFLKVRNKDKLMEMERLYLQSKQKE